MKSLMRLMLACLFAVGHSAVCQGQRLADPIEATLCDLYHNPEQYTGKMVKVRAAVAGDDLSIDSFTEKPCPTYMRVIVIFPNRVKPAPGFDLIRDKSFEEFEDALHHDRPIHIDATFEGRFDAAFYWRDHKRIPVGPSDINGFGKNHKYDGRIVLHQVSDVVAKSRPHK
jgi:hypothetical protein